MAVLWCTGMATPSAGNVASFGGDGAGEPYELPGGRAIYGSCDNNRRFRRGPGPLGRMSGPGSADQSAQASRVSAIRYSFAFASQVIRYAFG